MKVHEKNTDRTAEVHIHVDGQMQGLEEYGEYVDRRDDAICCYVPVEEGHKLSIRGKFSGTTLTVVYDAIVDGVLCKTNSFEAKSVYLQKNKKLDVDKFLYKVHNGIIDTNIAAGRLFNLITYHDVTPDHVGYIELRLYVTRHLGVFHAVNDVGTYLSQKSQYEQDIAEIAHDLDQVASYRNIEPDFQMAFEKDCAPLEIAKANRERSKMNKPRPGTRPWAVFRFYYRSKDTISANGLKETYDPSRKVKTEGRALLLKAVPPLVPGTKAPLDDDDGSTPESSVAPESPTTPLKSTRKEPANTPTPAQKQQSNVSARKSAETILSPQFTDDLQAHRLFSTSSKMDGNSDKVAEVSMGTTHNDPDTIVVNTVPKPATAKPEGKGKAADRDTIAVVIPKKTTTSVRDSAAKVSSLLSTLPVMQTKKPVGLPEPLNIAAPVAEEKPATPTTPISPSKRAGTPTLTDNEDAKRTKISSAPPASSMLLLMFRAPSASSQPGHMSIERKVAEQRKKLEDMRQKRHDMAKKQSALDEEIEPYRKRMAKELERLEQEFRAEEAAFEEEQDAYQARLEMFEEFKTANEEGRGPGHEGASRWGLESV